MLQREPLSRFGTSLPSSRLAEGEPADERLPQLAGQADSALKRSNSPPLELSDAVSRYAGAMAAHYSRYCRNLTVT